MAPRIVLSGAFTKDATRRYWNISKEHRTILLKYLAIILKSWIVAGLGSSLGEKSKVSYGMHIGARENDNSPFRIHNTVYCSVNFVRNSTKKIKEKTPVQLPGSFRA